MIKNFHEFDLKIAESNYTFTADDLSLYERSLLQTTVILWDVKAFSKAHDIINIRLGCKLPHYIVRQVFVEDLDLALELINGTLNDTWSRNLFLGSITKKIGAGNLPAFGENNEAVNDFRKRLAASVRLFGGQILVNHES